MTTLLVLEGVTTVIFGLASLFFISRSRTRLSQGSIRKYMDNFAICLAFVVIFSLWQTMRSIFGLDIDVSDYAAYPEYIFIVFAYIGFVIASYRILKISEEFGFNDSGRKIAQLVQDGQLKKRAKKRR